MTNEFRDWVKDIKENIENCLGDLADIRLEEYEIDKYPLVICTIVKSNELRTHMAFDQSEYDNNDKEQRCKLVKIRCNDMTQSIEDEINELKKVTEVLRTL